VAVAVEDPRACSDEDAADVLDELRGALDRLEAFDARVLSVGDTMVGLWQLAARVEALVCRQAAAFARYGEWADVGAKNAAAWLTVETRCDPTVARARVRRGRALGRMDLVSAAFAAGLIGVEHVDRLARACTPRTALVFHRDEAMLVDWAATMPSDVFVTALAEWLYRADADREEQLAERQCRRRRVHLSQSFEDTWYLNGVLDPISGQIVNDVLSRIERELFAADWADAKTRLGRRPNVDELARSTPQRRADALVEMATRAATTPKGGQRPGPLVTLLVGVDAFAATCRLAAGTNVTPGQAARWLDQSIIERIVFDGPNRVLSVGRQREFTGALRRAIEVRDRTCQHPYCDEPAERCQVDHTVPWALGGRTTQANGKLHCGFHNRNREPEHIRHKRRTRRSKRPKPDADE
jgi:hypothetical protein